MVLSGLEDCGTGSQEIRGEDVSAGPVGLPTVVLSAAQLRDAELVLMGALHGLVLGAGISFGQQAGDGPAERVALVGLDSALVETAMGAGGLELADDELTPIAELRELTLVDGRLTGDLSRRRWRESGAARQHALTPADLAPGAALADTALVLARPPVAADDAPLAHLLSAGRVLILVPDRAEDTDGVPTDTMVSLAHALAERHGVAQPEVRLVPLAWRDPASNSALVAAVARRFAGSRALALGVDTGAPTDADIQWSAARATLDAGRDQGRIAVLAPEDEAALRRWRPLRTERGVVMMFSGFSGSGKSTVARAVADQLVRDTPRTVSLLDGDVVRRMLSSGLGFDRASRILNVTRIGYVGAEIARHGGIAICAPIAPYEQTREVVREMVEAVGDFVLVHVNTPLEECERRDLKGLYAKARAGLIPEFTGISDPYDVPPNPALRLDTSVLSRDDAVAEVIAFLADGGWITSPGSAPDSSPRESP